MRATESRLSGEHGGAGLLTIMAALMVAGLCASGVSAVNAVVGEAVRARISADLTALASVNWGLSTAERVAEANGVSAVEHRSEKWETEVTVRIGQVEAVGRAALVE